MLYILVKVWSKFDRQLWQGRAHHAALCQAQKVLRLIHIPSLVQQVRVSQRERRFHTVEWSPSLLNITKVFAVLSLRSLSRCCRVQHGSESKLGKASETAVICCSSAHCIGYDVTSSSLPAAG